MSTICPLISNGCRADKAIDFRYNRGWGKMWLKSPKLLRVMALYATPVSAGIKETF